MSQSSVTPSRPNSVLETFIDTLRATPMFRSLVERRSANASSIDNDPWNDPGGMSDEMERKFIARESRRW